MGSSSVPSILYDPGYGVRFHKLLIVFDFFSMLHINLYNSNICFETCRLKRFHKLDRRHFDRQDACAAHLEIPGGQKLAAVRDHWDNGRERHCAWSQKKEKPWQAGEEEGGEGNLPGLNC